MAAGQNNIGGQQIPHFLTNVNTLKRQIENPQEEEKVRNAGKWKTLIIKI